MVEVRRPELVEVRVIASAGDRAGVCVVYMLNLVLTGCAMAATANTY